MDARTRTPSDRKNSWHELAPTSIGQMCLPTGFDAWIRLRRSANALARADSTQALASRDVSRPRRASFVLRRSGANPTRRDIGACVDELCNGFGPHPCRSAETDDTTSERAVCDQPL